MQCTIGGKGKMGLTRLDARSGKVEDEGSLGEKRERI